MATWLAGALDYASVLVERSLWRRHRESHGDRALWWCSPYCNGTFRSDDARARHRVHCEAFHRYAAELLAKVRAR